MKLDEVIKTSNSDQKTCKQFSKQCSSCKTIINNLRPYITIGPCNSLTQRPIKMKLGMCMCHSHNNQSRHQSNHSKHCSKQCTCTCSSCKTPSGNTFNYLRTGRCRKTKLSEVIVTYMYNFDDANMQTITFVIILLKVNM